MPEKTLLLRTASLCVFYFNGFVDFFTKQINSKMKIEFKFLILLTLVSFTAFSQDKFFTRNATISFDAEGALKDVEKVAATNSGATCILDVATGQMEWAVLIRGFQFENALMQEHFNENYMESHKFPKSFFKGKINNLADINWKQDGQYPVTVAGKMTIHGVEKDIVAKGILSLINGKIGLKSNFEVTASDYGVKIPSIVGNKVANEVKISVNATLEKFVR